MANVEVVGADNAQELAKSIAGAEQLAIDTEFMREKTYFAQLCLVQVATPNTVCCFDPLTEGDPQPFWSAALDTAWVVHSGRQDIEVVYQSTGQMPAAIFDTQVAAALLGYAPQLGYAALVNDLFGKSLTKSQTRADWTRRPLSAAMLKYAAEDVEYLLEASDKLRERLATLDRLDWAEEDSAALLATKLYDVDLADAVTRIKSARNLKGRMRRAVVGLAAWRERRALRSNRPRRWILKDNVLVDIAKRNPEDVEALSKVNELPASVVRRDGRDLLALLREAEAAEDDYRPPRMPSEEDKATLKRMQAQVAAIAEHLGIAAEVIAPRKELSAALRGERDLRVFSGWRESVIGDQLRAELE